MAQTTDNGTSPASGEIRFCSYCGIRLDNGARFCKGCGRPVVQPAETANCRSSEQKAERKTVYEGAIHKCPNCGEVLASFVANCPSCGYELRDSRVSDSIAEFTSQLNRSATEDQKIEIIRNFPIPNTKEDISEYIIMASSNITGDLSKKTFDAWTAKFEQSYQKAKLIFKDDLCFDEIQRVYDSTSKKISRINAVRNARTIGAVVKKTVGAAGRALSKNSSSLPSIVICSAWIVSLFVLISLCGKYYGVLFQNILGLDFIGGAIFIPFVTKCKSILPTLIVTFGLVISEAVLFLLYWKFYIRSFEVMMYISTIASVIVFVRIFKKNRNHVD